MLVFMNQDAYDKFRLSKEDYALQKELAKEQKNTTETKKNGKKKGEMCIRDRHSMPCLLPANPLKQIYFLK